MGLIRKGSPRWGHLVAEAPPVAVEEAFDLFLSKGGSTRGSSGTEFYKIVSSSTGIPPHISAESPTGVQGREDRFRKETQAGAPTVCARLDI